MAGDVELVSVARGVHAHFHGISACPLRSWGRRRGRRPAADAGRRATGGALHRARKADVVQATGGAPACDLAARAATRRKRRSLALAPPPRSSIALTRSFTPPPSAAARGSCWAMRGVRSSKKRTAFWRGRASRTRAAWWSCLCQRLGNAPNSRADALPLPPGRGEDSPTPRDSIAVLRRLRGQCASSP